MDLSGRTCWRRQSRRTACLGKNATISQIWLSSAWTKPRSGIHCMSCALHETRKERARLGLPGPRVSVTRDTPRPPPRALTPVAPWRVSVYISVWRLRGGFLRFFLHLCSHCGWAPGPGVSPGSRHVYVTHVIVKPPLSALRETPRAMRPRRLVGCAACAAGQSRKVYTGA